MKRCYCCMKEYKEEYMICPHCGYEEETPQKGLYYLPTGTMIAERYEIGISVGSGGFGITYKAWDHMLEKVVALKEYYPVGLVNRIPGEKNIIIYSGQKSIAYRNGMVRFLDEARNMAKFNTNANIVNVYDFFEENDTAYIVMEYLEGINYKEYLKRINGKDTVDQALEVTNSVLEALKVVHKAGIVHRDISPDNIFLCDDGRIKIIDFGAARFSSADEEKTRSIILKPGFAPPEQYKSKSKQGPWTDIYAVAATLYKAITGKVPEESINRVEVDHLIPPKELCDEINDNQNNAIMRAMSLLPELRFQNAEEFQRALKGDKKVAAVANVLKRKKRNRAISIIITSVLILIGAFLSFQYYKQQQGGIRHLQQATVSVWILAESKDEIEDRKDTMEAALNDFREMYPQVTIEITCLSEPQYSIALEEALETGNAPVLFDSTNLPSKQLDSCEDVSGIWQQLATEEYYFMSQYDTYYPSHKQVPISFCVPVIYINQYINQENLSVEELIQDENFLISLEDIITYNNLFMDKEDIVSFNGVSTNNLVCDLAKYIDIEDSNFVDNQTGCLISNTSKYGFIQNKMAGIYEIQMLNEQNMMGHFRDCYSISKIADKKEKAAALQIIVYLLSENAQDIQYVQNGNTLPLNKNIYQSYEKINIEFNGLQDSFDKIIFAGEFQGDVED